MRGQRPRLQGTVPPQKDARTEWAAFSLALLGVARYHHACTVVGEEESDVGSARDDHDLCYAFEKMIRGVLWGPKRRFLHPMRSHMVVVSCVPSSISKQRRDL